MSNFEKANVIYHFSYVADPEKKVHVSVPYLTEKASDENIHRFGKAIHQLMKEDLQYDGASREIYELVPEKEA
ncbi:hypothetical protein [Catellicoccus marimammalium]|uniref:Uncharacterized protein n=1 Tax=Catellicoccus marimammalium M35/04/3 TaxID=1234409 RepID=K8ZN29_9ENTE|nr:hypothetical protein [Catellicoccus marimammalium]EKU27001.1 hypothetical protein C683_0997 [Catellicoccus marimammalium M35/04/3]